MIIKKNTTNIQLVPRAKGICLGLTFFTGNYYQLVEKFTKILKNIHVTPRLGFIDIIVPGVIRNDFYITLEEGIFSLEKKSSVNIEITIQVIYIFLKNLNKKNSKIKKDNGEIVKVFFR